MAIERFNAKVDDLLFDPENPRLPETIRKTQSAIFRYLVDEISVEDVMSSMASSGMINADPIIVRDAPNGKYYVVEGNRRLAALKLLNGSRIGDGGEEPNVPAVAPEVAETLREVRVEKGWEQDALDAYLGYKHVTATREWTPEAKARFVLDRCGADRSDENLRKFAERLGTNLATLKRWIIARLALKQAEQRGIFDPKKAYNKRYFGTFYTLLGSTEVQQFLSLRNDVLHADVVPDDRLDHLKDFISWVIGTKQQPPVVNSRRQRELEVVLSSPRALDYFRQKRDLPNALLYTEFNANEVASKLRRAAFEMQDCLATLNDVKDDHSVQEAIEELSRAYDKVVLNVRPAEPKKR
jgi:hypothetical protein